MLPFSLPLPVSVDTTLLLNILKGLFFTNPATVLWLGVLIVFWLSIKSMTLKLALLGSSLILSSLVTYLVHTKQKNKTKEYKKINISEEFMEYQATVKDRENQELMLSKLFQKK